MSPGRCYKRACIASQTTKCIVNTVMCVPWNIHTVTCKLIQMHTYVHIHLKVARAIIVRSKQVVIPLSSWMQNRADVPHLTAKQSLYTKGRCSVEDVAWPELSSPFSFTLVVAYGLPLLSRPPFSSPSPCIQWATRHSWHFAKVERQRTFVS